MFKALIEGQTIAQMLDLAGRLRSSRADFFEALQPEELSGAHVFILAEIVAHIEELEARMGRIEQALLAGLSLWRPQLVVLQTIPGIDVMGAAMLLVEISGKRSIDYVPCGDAANLIAMSAGC